MGFSHVGPPQVDEGRIRRRRLSPVQRQDVLERSADDYSDFLDCHQAGARIFSVYGLSDGAKVWIITEADRSSTCILLPEEY
jgi:hypothetical protein